MESRHRPRGDGTSAVPRRDLRNDSRRSWVAAVQGWDRRTPGFHDRYPVPAPWPPRRPCQNVPMPARTDTCGECGTSMTFPDGDWETVQAPAIKEWERQHEQDAHGGEEV